MLRCGPGLRKVLPETSVSQVEDNVAVDEGWVVGRGLNEVTQGPHVSRRPDSTSGQELELRVSMYGVVFTH